MPSRSSIPRIRVDLSDGSSCGLSPSGTLDIKDVLGLAKPLPKLLAEDSVFDGVDDALYFEDGRLRNFPSFPIGRRPPLFVLNSHRARLPFPIRPDAFELGDFCMDEEDACPLLTAPTVPRMKMMIKEQLYMQKWVNTLTPGNPPRHIPWTCEKPATKRSWIAEGSIFPADMGKPGKSSVEHRGTVPGYICITDANRLSALTDHSREVCALSGAFGPIQTPSESDASAQHGSTKSADDESNILRGESKTSYTPHHTVGISRASSPPTLLPSGPPTETASSTPEAPLAARRGKSLSSMKLRGSVIEHLEYPDIPTAFRSSPIIWSPRFDTFTVPSFTDHENMLSDLKSKYAAIENGVSTYIQEPPRPRSEPIRTSLGVEEWTFTRELATFGNSSGSTDNQLPREIVVDSSIFFPNNFSTPVKSPDDTARLGFIPRPPPAPASRSPGNRSSDPPRVPLPPRPALIHPSTLPHVRGILKKVKSVRFEDVTTKNCTPAVLLPKATPGCSSPLPLATSSGRPCTPVPNAAKSSSGPLPPKETFGRNTQKKSAAKSRPPPKRTKANEKLSPTRFNVGSAPESSKHTLAATSAGCPCQIAHNKENTNLITTSQAQAKGSAVTEIDVRRGIEGTARSRLSTPLRSIFRFK